MTEPMKPTAEEHEILLRLNPELARYGSNSLWYNFTVKDRGRAEAASFKRAQEVLAIVRPILQERDRLRGALNKVVASLSYHEALAVAQGALTETAHAER